MGNFSDYNNKQQKYNACDEQNTIVNFIPNEVDVVHLPSDIPEYDIEDYDLFDEKDKIKYVKDLERFVRNSLEYKQFVQYLREYMNMKNCAFLQNVSNEDTAKIRIELHHSPLTLFEICNVIINKRMRLGESMNIEDVAYEVMYVHYCLMVGLIPLSETVHELVHNQFIFIPANRVYGYYKAFVRQYADYIDDELLDKLNKMEQVAQDDIYNNYMRILEKKYISVDMGDNSQLPYLEQTRELMKNRLVELKTEMISSASSKPIMNYSNVAKQQIQQSTESEEATDNNKKISPFKYIG